MKSILLNIQFLFIVIILFNLGISQDIITFSEKSGFYPNDFELTLSSSDGSKIYYTIDGSDPFNSNTTKEYTKPILIKDRSDEPNIYSDIAEDENSPVSVTRGIGYKKPPFLVEKGMVVRAVAKNEQGFSKVIEHSYFITTGQLSQYEQYTVVSLVTNPDNLFDPDKGIYVTGTQYINWKKSDNYDPRKSAWDIDNICNYFSEGKEWERPASIAIFEAGKLTIEQNIGIRIKGSSTRNLQQKNFNIYARKEYGKGKIKSETLFPNNYDINGNLITEYDSFSLRAIPSQDRARDQFSIRLIKDREFQTTYYAKNAVLFLNGEYWGMYAIIEKFSSQFFASHYGILKDDVVYIKEQEIKEGPSQEYLNLKNFMRLYSKKDLSDEKNYKDVCDIIDIDSFIDHYAANIYLATYDWPNHNFGMWKNNGKKIDGNLYSDGRWRFMTYDLDYTVGETYEDFGGVEGYQYDTFKHMERGQNYEPTNLFVALLKNEQFKNKFVKVYEEYAYNIMSIDKAMPLLQEFYENITPMLCYSQSRWWGYFGGTRLETIAYAKNEFCNKVLPKMQKFFEERPKYTLDHMKEYLNRI